MINPNYIDHTILKSNATKEDIINLCNEAIKYKFKSVCINPCYVKLAKELLKDSDVLVCTVIGFPLGANTISTKVFETKQAILDGADEIDLVVNISKLIENDKSYVLDEINQIVDAANNKTTKVIVETCYLDHETKELAAKIVLESKADFIKTSTGFGVSGANINDIKLWKSILNDNKKIKASGGIKTPDFAKELIDAGADRIGSSASIDLIK